MNLQQTAQMLRRAIDAEHNDPVFADAGHRHPILATLETTRSTLWLLADTSPVNRDRKEQLLRAFIAELQRNAHPLWSALCILACYPMLRRLRSRVRGNAVDGCELDQIIVAIFLEVLAAFELDRKRDRTFMHLRQFTQRRLFRHLQAEQQHQERMFPTADWRLLRRDETRTDLDERPRWPETTHHGRRVPDLDERAEQTAFLVAHAGDLLDSERLDLVITTLVHGERLRRYVDRHFPDLGPRDRERAYQRLKRRHSRAIAKLRASLAHLRPAARPENPGPETP